jgi:hypothetical protein
LRQGGHTRLGPVPRLNGAVTAQRAVPTNSVFGLKIQSARSRNHQTKRGGGRAIGGGDYSRIQTAAGCLLH